MSKSLVCNKHCPEVIKLHVSYSGASCISSLYSDQVRTDAQNFKRMMVGNKVLDEEEIMGVMEEVSSSDTIRDLVECVQEELMKVSRVIPLNSVDMYVVVSDYVEMVNVCTKYKTIDKKVKPSAFPCLWIVLIK